MALKLGFVTCELSHTHGWAHYSLSLLQALQRAGVQMTVVAARNCPDIEGLTIHRVLPNTYPRERWLLPKMMLQSRQVCSLLSRCDMIHATIEPYAPLAAWAAGDRPLFVTGHGSYMRLSQERRWPVSMMYRQAFEAAHLVCVSRYTEKTVRAVIPNAHTFVINNGVDVERFHDAGTHAARDNNTVLSVGAVKARKGTLELVQAMAEVRRQRPETRCIIIGSLNQETAYVERVKQAIHDLDLSNTVHLLGHVPDETLLEWYHQASVFALPSINDGWKFEGYGIVYLEASAAGLPVIGTSDNGAEDAVDDGVTGLIVSQAQVAEQLPAAILRLLSDGEVAVRMGAAGRAKAERQTWDHVAQRMIEVYRGV